MKKFYAFAAAALLATAANAQTLYIVGAGDGLEWTPGTPAEMTLANGEYSIQVNNLVQFKISTVAGSWDEFNSGALGCDYGEEAGVAVALEPGNTSNIMAPWEGDYTITVSGDMSTITLTTTTPKPAVGTLPSIYFRGGMNGWGTEDAWKFEALSMTVFKFVCSDEQAITPEDEFKIADSSWGKYNVGGGDEPLIMLETEMEVFNGGDPANLKIEEVFNGIAWLNLDIDGQAFLILSNDKTFVPEWDIDLDAVETIEVANDAPVYYNLQGVRVANPANGIYVKVVNGKATKAVIK